MVSSSSNENGKLLPQSSPMKKPARKRVKRKKRTKNQTKRKNAKEKKPAWNADTKMPVATPVRKHNSRKSKSKSKKNVPQLQRLGKSPGLKRPKTKSGRIILSRSAPKLLCSGASRVLGPLQHKLCFKPEELAQERASLALRKERPWTASPVGGGGRNVNGRPLPPLSKNRMRSSQRMEVEQELTQGVLGSSKTFSQLRATSLEKEAKLAYWENILVDLCKLEGDMNSPVPGISMEVCERRSSVESSILEVQEDIEKSSRYTGTLLHMIERMEVDKKRLAVSLEKRESKLSHMKLQRKHLKRILGQLKDMNSRTIGDIQDVKKELNAARKHWSSEIYMKKTKLQLGKEQRNLKKKIRQHRRNSILRIEGDLNPKEEADLVDKEREQTATKLSIALALKGKSESTRNFESFVQHRADSFAGKISRASSDSSIGSSRATKSGKKIRTLEEGYRKLQNVIGFGTPEELVSRFNEQESAAEGLNKQIEDKKRKLEKVEKQFEAKKQELHQLQYGENLFEKELKAKLTGAEDQLLHASRRLGTNEREYQRLNNMYIRMRENIVRLGTKLSAVKVPEKVQGFTGEERVRRKGPNYKFQNALNQVETSVLAMLRYVAKHQLEEDQNKVQSEDRNSPPGSPKSPLASTSTSSVRSQSPHANKSIKLNAIKSPGKAMGLIDRKKLLEVENDMLKLLSSPKMGNIRVKCTLPKRPASAYSPQKVSSDTFSETGSMVDEMSKGFYEDQSISSNITSEEVEGSQALKPVFDPTAIDEVFLKYDRANRGVIRAQSLQAVLNDLHIRLKPLDLSVSRFKLQDSKGEISVSFRFYRSFISSSNSRVFFSQYNKLSVWINARSRQEQVIDRSTMKSRNEGMTTQPPKQKKKRRGSVMSQGSI